VRASYKEGGKFSDIISSKPYVKGSEKIKEGSVMCNLKDKNNVYCGIVLENSGGKVTTLGKKGNTLSRIDMSSTDRNGIVVFTYPENSYENSTVNTGVDNGLEEHRMAIANALEG